MSLIDDELQQMIKARFQLCDGDDTGAGDQPYNASWARAVLVSELVTMLHLEVKAGTVAGLVAPGELEGLARLVEAAQQHTTDMAGIMAAASPGE